MANSRPEAEGEARQQERASHPAAGLAPTAIPNLTWEWELAGGGMGEAA